MRNKIFMFISAEVFYRLGIVGTLRSDNGDVREKHLKQRRQRPFLLNF